MRNNSLGERNKLLLIPLTVTLFQITNPTELIGPIHIVERNHVLYWNKIRFDHGRDKVSLLSTFDFITWWLIFISIFGLIFTDLMIDLILKRYHLMSFTTKISMALSKIHFYLNSALFVPVIRDRIPVKTGRVLAAVWLLSLFFLVRFFTSDMLAHLTIRMPSKVIDSVEDLCENEHIPIRLISVEENEIDVFKSGSEVERCLGERMGYEDPFGIKEIIFVFNKL